MSKIVCHYLYRLPKCRRPLHFYNSRSLKTREGTVNLSDLITFKKLGAITCIGLNRPSKKNCLNYELAHSLKNAIKQFEGDDSSSVGILYGELGNFCHGFCIEDINEDSDILNKIHNLDILGSYCPKPMVAAVNGFAMGPGFDLSLWCDFRIVEETAVLGYQTKELGIPLTDTSIKLLSNILGFNKTLDWVLTGRVVLAKEAFSCGIVNRLVACGTSLGQAVNFACGLASVSQTCLKADRASIYSLMCKERFSEELMAKIVEQKDTMRKEAIEELVQRAKGLKSTSSLD